MVCGIEVYSFSNGLQTLVRNDDLLLNVSDNNRLVVYPNPVSKTLNIRFPESYTGNYHVDIIDPIGKVFPLRTYMINSGGSTSTDLSRFAFKPGIYLLRVKSESGKMETEKIVIQ